LPSTTFKWFSSLPHTTTFLTYLPTFAPSAIPHAFLPAYTCATLPPARLPPLFTACSSLTCHYYCLPPTTCWRPVCPAPRTYCTATRTDIALTVYTCHGGSVAAAPYRPPVPRTLPFSTPLCACLHTCFSATEHFSAVGPTSPADHFFGTPPCLPLQCHHHLPMPLPTALHLPFPHHHLPSPATTWVEGGGTCHCWTYHTLHAHHLHHCYLPGTFLTMPHTFFCLCLCHLPHSLPLVLPLPPLPHYNPMPPDPSATPTTLPPARTTLPTVPAPPATLEPAGRPTVFPFTFHILGLPLACLLPPHSWTSPEKKGHSGEAGEACRTEGNEAVIYQATLTETQFSLEEDHSYYSLTIHLPSTTLPFPRTGATTTTTLQFAMGCLPAPPSPTTHCHTAALLPCLFQTTYYHTPPLPLPCLGHYRAVPTIPHVLPGTGHCTPHYFSHCHVTPTAPAFTTTITYYHGGNHGGGGGGGGGRGRREEDHHPPYFYHSCLRGDYLLSSIPTCYLPSQSLCVLPPCLFYALPLRPGTCVCLGREASPSPLPLPSCAREGGGKSHGDPPPVGEGGGGRACSTCLCPLPASLLPLSHTTPLSQVDGIPPAPAYLRTAAPCCHLPPYYAISRYLCHCLPPHRCHYHALPLPTCAGHCLITCHCVLVRCRHLRTIHQLGALPLPPPCLYLPCRSPVALCRTPCATAYLLPHDAVWAAPALPLFCLQCGPSYLRSRLLACNLPFAPSCLPPYACCTLSLLPVHLHLPSVPASIRLPPRASMTRCLHAPPRLPPPTCPRGSSSRPPLPAYHSLFCYAPPLCHMPASSPQRVYVATHTPCHGCFVVPLLPCWTPALHRR